MKRKLLALLAVTGCFMSLAALAKADIVIIHSDGSHTVIESSMWAIVVYDASGKATTTVVPSPKPPNTAN
jgi:hypothetical protein